uniref:helix-turn-helix domain-containing protein n=1 Tax=uncultured Tenacibaculum sp. TaxID=174713 RepID=UPI002623BD12|nr:helix-turn-helix domain-containing protein [uncultured Tenacibaculum sp.]
MSNVYVLTQKQLDETIETIVERLRKTDLVSSTFNTQTSDRLTQKEASELLGISVQCLIQWKKKKLVPFYQIGRSIFYSKKELLQIARKNPLLIKPKRK